MNLALTLLEIVAPVFLLAGAGFVWVRAGFEYRVEFVTRLAMTLSVPCLIFVALMRAEIDPKALTALSFAAVAAYAVLTVAAAIMVRVTGLSMRPFLAPLIFGNTGNLGLPLALFAFGDVGLSYAVIVFAIMALWSFTFGIWVVAGGGSMTRALKEPLLWATVLGGIFLWQGWQTPRWITNTLELTGQMAIPLMLLTLGVAVARLNPGKLVQAMALSVVKVGLCVAVAWVLGRAFALDDVAFAVLVVQIATPVAVTSYLLAEKYGADSDAVAGLVVASTLASVIYLPLVLAAVL